ncbi:hypothetical protein MPLDJ20_110156 [Mesorhizobium plurifarium]|uniref:Uncharacterized protein n=1 Tax=Mesorhizobium plurifarium TaxID=69974 RepID=A0A090DUL5_MESPL|nr:hypothetical protein MPLDJ20_110156 [Mesorhizobium plurifarium]
MTFGTSCNSTVSGSVLPIFNSTPGTFTEASGCLCTYSLMTVSCSGAMTTSCAAAAPMPARSRKPAAAEVKCIFIGCLSYVDCIKSPRCCACDFPQRVGIAVTPFAYPCSCKIQTRTRKNTAAVFRETIICARRSNFGTMLFGRGFLNEGTELSEEKSHETPAYHEHDCARRRLRRRDGPDRVRTAERRR